MVNLLSEKYSLFYGFTKLTNLEKDNINSILIELTNFADLFQTQDLIGVLFNFRLDSYYTFLKNNVSLVKFDDVKKEILDALKEYDEL